MKADFVEKHFESENVYTFVFRPETEMTWLPGQFIDFTLPSGKVKHFTIASAPYEKTINITTRIFDQPSEYKSELLSLVPGDTIRLSKPQGELTLDKNHVGDYVFIAGGIGITPFRAICWDMARQQHDVRATLLYASTTEQPPFMTELVRVAAECPSLKIKYFLQDKQITEADISSVATDSTMYLLSGPPKMVEAYEKMLSNMGVHRKMIKSDIFWGY